MKMIPKSSLKKYYNQTPLPYEDYLCWLDENFDSKYRFDFVPTFNYEVRERQMWNTLGREIHDSEKLAEHASKIGAILNLIRAKHFFVQHTYSPKVWLPNFVIKEGCKNIQIEKKISAIYSFFPEIDLTQFDGGFEFYDDVLKFINEFIDYPFVLHHSNIDCISLDRDLIVQLNHHLDVWFISTDQKLLKTIEDECKNLDLKILARTYS